MGVSGVVLGRLGQEEDPPAACVLWCCLIQVLQGRDIKTIYLHQVLWGEGFDTDLVCVLQLLVRGVRDVKMFDLQQVFWDVAGFRCCGGVAGVVLGCSEHEEDLPAAGVL